MIEKMIALRDRTEGLASLLNPLVGARHSLGYSRLFIHADHGFGHYPRFLTASQWGEKLDSRIAVFRSAINPEDWASFLEWWPCPAGLEAARVRLRDQLGALRADDYDLLLRVMLSTPVSWSDREYWNILRESGAPDRPFLARWIKEDANDPWHLTALKLRDGRSLAEGGSAEVRDGILPESAPAHLAPIFWQFLYPLCNREKFNPPQDPAKHFSGTLLHVILPLFDVKQDRIQGWVLCNVEASDDHAALLEMFLDGPVASAWGAVAEAIRDELTNA